MKLESHHRLTKENTKLKRWCFGSDDQMAFWMEHYERINNRTIIKHLTIMKVLPTLMSIMVHDQDGVVSFFELGISDKPNKQVLNINKINRDLVRFSSARHTGH